jgi:hypothetical protein
MVHDGVVALLADPVHRVESGIPTASKSTRERIDALVPVPDIYAARPPLAGASARPTGP